MDTKPCNNSVEKTRISNNFCQEFVRNAEARRMVLGSSQFCIDLCETLRLPITVVSTSLYYMQNFLETFNIEAPEIGLLCGSCVLLSWKYWEDFEDIRNVRKLNDICCALYMLLMLPDDRTSQGESLEPFLASVKVDSKPVGHSKDCLSPTNWILRDEGREIGRIKEKIKVYEACLLRCLDYEPGPLELPFDTINVLTRLLWTDEVAWQKASRASKKTRVGYTASVRSEGAVEFSSTESRHSTLLSHNGTNSFTDGTATTTGPIMTDAAPLLVDREKPVSACDALEPNKSETQSEPQYWITLLDKFIYLSQGIALDYFRSPFCLLSRGTQIGTAAVWKAAVLLGFGSPFQNAVDKFLERHSVDAHTLYADTAHGPKGESSSDSSNATNSLHARASMTTSEPDHPFFQMMSDVDIRLVLERFRFLYKWLEEYIKWQEAQLRVIQRGDDPYILEQCASSLHA